MVIPTNKFLMKKILILLSIAAFACNAPKSDEAKTTDAKEESSAAGQSVKVDPSASRMEWIGTKVSGYHSGTVNIKNGELMVSNGQVTGGSFVIDMPTIVATGPESVNEESCKKLTGHLHSPDFFDVQKYPEATFTITSVKPFEGEFKDDDDPRQEKLKPYKVVNPTHRVAGNLTIKGITKNIEFPAQISVTGNAVQATAKFNVDRREWDITYPGSPDDLIRHDIHFGVALNSGNI